MKQKDDKTFIRKFSGIILGFIVLTVVLVFVARSMQGEPDPDANPSHVFLQEERIQPVAGVRVGAEGMAELAEAQAVSAPAADAGTGGEVDGEQVYNGLCQTCHSMGVAGAPVPGSELMAQRLSEKGLDVLVGNAINGLNVMPPRGGNPALSDEQIQAAVEFMLN